MSKTDDPAVLEARAARARDIFARSIKLKSEIMERQCGDLAKMAAICIASLRGGGKLLICGNGGSAADAQHLAAELLVRLQPNIDRQPIPAIALALDTSSLTACGNDYSFESYFERMVQALGKSGDVLLAITTSGTSPNILRALRAAREAGIETIGLLGNEGGKAKALCNEALVVHSAETGRVQEAHITAGHALMELIEESYIEHSR